jgi:hypothetical protein
MPAITALLKPIRTVKNLQGRGDQFMQLYSHRVGIKRGGGFDKNSHQHPLNLNRPALPLKNGNRAAHKT